MPRQPTLLYFQSTESSAPDYSGYVSIDHLKTALLAIIKSNQYNAEAIVNIVAQVNLRHFFWNGVLLQKKRTEKEVPLSI